MQATGRRSASPQEIQSWLNSQSRSSIPQLGSNASALEMQKAVNQFQAPRGIAGLRLSPQEVSASMQSLYPPGSPLARLGGTIGNREVKLIAPPPDSRFQTAQEMIGGESVDWRRNLPEQYGVPGFFSRRNLQELGGGNEVFPTTTFGSLSSAPGYAAHLMEQTRNNPETASMLKTKLTGLQSQLRNAPPNSQAYLQQSVARTQAAIAEAEKQNVARMLLGEKYTGLSPQFRGLEEDVTRSGQAIPKMFGMKPTEVLNLQPPDTSLLMQGSEALSPLMSLREKNPAYIPNYMDAQKQGLLNVSQADLLRLSARQRAPRDFAIYDAMVPRSQQGINYPETIQMRQGGLSRNIQTGQSLDDLMQEIDSTAMQRAPGKIEEVWMKNQSALPYAVQQRSISGQQLAMQGVNLQGMSRPQKQQAVRNALFSDREMGYDTGGIAGQRDLLSGSGQLGVYDRYRQELGETPTLSQQLEAATSMPGEKGFTGLAAQWKTGQHPVGPEVNIFAEGNHPRIMATAPIGNSADFMHDAEQQRQMAKGLFNQSQAQYDSSLSEIARQYDFERGPLRDPMGNVTGVHGSSHSGPAFTGNMANLKSAERQAADALDSMITAGQVYSDNTPRPGAIDYSKLQPIVDSGQTNLQQEIAIKNRMEQEGILRKRGQQGFTPTDELYNSTAAQQLRERFVQPRETGIGIPDSGLQANNPFKGMMKMIEVENAHNQQIPSRPIRPQLEPGQFAIGSTARNIADNSLKARAQRLLKMKGLA